MHIPEPDFSEMIRKSDSTRRAAKKQEKKIIKKELPKENINKTPAEAFSHKSKDESKTQKKETVKQTQKEIFKKAPKASAKNKVFVNTSGLIYTVQIAAVDQKSKKYSTINNVITYNENSLVKYSLGTFKTRRKANAYRKKINKKYKGAFVKALKNNIPVQINK